MPDRTLILGLGNEVLADDGVGVLAIRRLRDELAHRTDVDVVETPEHGLALLDYLIGYDSAIIIDAMQSGQHPPGAVIELDPSILRAVESPSPHYAGLPEVLDLGRRLDLPTPRRVIILAVEVSDLLTLGGEMTPAVRLAVPVLCRRVARALERLRTFPRIDGAASSPRRAEFV